MVPRPDRIVGPNDFGVPRRKVEPGSRRQGLRRDPGRPFANPRPVQSLTAYRKRVGWPQIGSSREGKTGSPIEKVSPGHRTVWGLAHRRTCRGCSRCWRWPPPTSKS